MPPQVRAISAWLRETGLIPRPEGFEMRFQRPGQKSRSSIYEMIGYGFAQAVHSCRTVALYELLAPKGSRELAREFSIACACLGKENCKWASHHRLVPKYFLIPIVLYRPHGPLFPRSAGPRFRFLAPNRSNKKCWVTRNSNPFPR
jgi:hypothetical protein